MEHMRGRNRICSRIRYKNRASIRVSRRNLVKSIRKIRT